jgi:hypothetical protein
MKLHWLFPSGFVILMLCGCVMIEETEVYNNTGQTVLVTFTNTWEKKFEGGLIETGRTVSSERFDEIRITAGTNVWTYQMYPRNRPPFPEWEVEARKYVNGRGVNPALLRFQLEADGTLYYLTKKQKFPAKSLNADSGVIAIKPQ